MEEKHSIETLIETIKSSMELSKCRKCGCMKESIETIKSELAPIDKNDFEELLSELEVSIEKMEAIEHT